MYRPSKMVRIFILVFSIFSVSFYCTAGELIIYFIDVEQADATLLVSPSGKTLLVDSGRNWMGARIKAVMDEAGVTSIDYLVTSHYHEDHFGGIDDLVELGVAVDQAYDRGDKAFLPDAKKTQETYIHYENAVGSGATHLMRGETIPFDDDAVVTAISSGGVVLGEANPTPANDENDMSLSLLINFEGFQLFLGGDMEKPTEVKIAELDLVKDVDIYKSNHHGSDTSSFIDFMEDLKPSVIVISNGNNANHQHPRLSTLLTYSRANPCPARFANKQICKRWR
jgi:competence protein ComEC